MKKQIYYLFRRPVIRDIALAKKKLYPEDLLYGYLNISKKFQTQTSDVFFSKKPLLWLEIPLQTILKPVFKVGFSFVGVCLHLTNIWRSDLVFATVDSYGLPLALFNKIKLVNKPIVLNTIGLCDSLVNTNSKLYLKFCKSVLASANRVVSGASWAECRKMAQILNLPISKFSFIKFGIDTSFFKPSKTQQQSYILIIGADPSRDWSLYKKIIKHLSNFNFVIVTNNKMEDMPSNTKIFYNVPIIKVREMILQSLCMLILSKENYHFAGQSTAFRGMSCGKAVVMTKSKGVSEYGMRNYQDCILVSPGNEAEVIRALKLLLTNDNKRKEIGANARNYILDNCNIDSYADKLSGLFGTVLRGHNV